MDVVHYPKKLKIKLDLNTTGTDATSTLKYVGYWLVEAEYILVVKDEYSGRGFVKPMRNLSYINQAFDSVMDDIV